MPRYDCDTHCDCDDCAQDPPEAIECPSCGRMVWEWFADADGFCPKCV